MIYKKTLQRWYQNLDTANTLLRKVLDTDDRTTLDYESQLKQSRRLILQTRKSIEEAKRDTAGQQSGITGTETSDAETAGPTDQA